MEEQNRTDPGGLKRHGDPLERGASGSDKPMGAKPGEGERRGDSGARQPGAGAPNIGAGSGGNVGVQSRPGTSPQWMSGQSGMERGSHRPGNVGNGGHGSGMKDRFGNFGDDITEKLRSNVGRVAETGLHRLAEEIRSIGHATHSAADKFEKEEHGQIGRYISEVTHRFDDAADYLEHQGFDGIIDDASNLARRNPAVFLGAAALVGFVVGRLISASGPRRESYGQGSSYGDEGSLFDQSSREERRPV